MIRYNPKGLSSQEAADSRRTHGDNVITPPKDDSAWKLFVEKFKDPIIRILLLAAVLSLAIGSVHKDFTESIGIICAIILATCVGFWFEWDAMRRFRRLNQVNDDIPVKVMRDGSIREIPRRDVVVGDVVYIESGETVPADGELVEAVSLRINESTLTGELEVDKTVDEAHFDSEATYPSNVALRGTTVADGYGVLVATAVGDATEAGRVTEQATVQRDEQMTAQPPADAPLETHRPGRHCACGRYFLRHARQGGLRRELVRARLARNIAAGAAYFHGLGGHHRDGRSRRTSDEHYAVAGDVHAANAQDQQPRAAHARLRNDGCRDGHLHRQDRHADPEPDARAGTGALRCASGA